MQMIAKYDTALREALSIESRTSDLWGKVRMVGKGRQRIEDWDLAVWGGTLTFGLLVQVEVVILEQNPTVSPESWAMTRVGGSRGAQRHV